VNIYNQPHGFGVKLHEYQRKIQTVIIKYEEPEENENAKRLRETWKRIKENMK
jgi:hypothetical protein